MNETINYTPEVIMVKQISVLKEPFKTTLPLFCNILGSVKGFSALLTTK